MPATSMLSIQVTLQTAVLRVTTSGCLCRELDANLQDVLARSTAPCRGRRTDRVVTYLGALVFQFATLPVEFSASHSARPQLETLRLVNVEEELGARSSCGSRP